MSRCVECLKVCQQLVTFLTRQNSLSQSTNNSRSSSLDGSRPTLNHAVPSKVVLIHYSALPSYVMSRLRLILSSSYLIVDNVVYLTIADKSYPRKLAFSYLDELSKEFAMSYGPKVETVRKPYAFVGFGGFICGIRGPCTSVLILTFCNRHIHVKNRTVIQGYKSWWLEPR